MKRVLTTSLIILALLSHSNLANAKSLPKLDIQKICNNSSKCINKQKRWKKEEILKDLWTRAPKDDRKFCVNEIKKNDLGYDDLSHCLAEMSFGRW